MQYKYCLIIDDLNVIQWLLSFEPDNIPGQGQTCLKSLTTDDIDGLAGCYQGCSYRPLQGVKSHSTARGILYLIGSLRVCGV